MPEVTWKMFFADINPQPTYFNEIDIKEIIDLMNDKGYKVQHFNLMSVANPRCYYVGKFISPDTRYLEESKVEPARVILDSNALPINNRNKPNGWDIYYENGIQKLMTSRDKIQELLNRFMNARESPRDNPDEINSFHKYLVESQVSLWKCLREWIIKK